MSKVAMLPDGWHWHKMAEICDFENGRFLAREALIPYGVPVYGANGIIGCTSEPSVNEPRLVLGRVGSVGVLNITRGSCWITDNTIICFPKEYTCFDYVAAYLQIVDFQKLSTATTQPLLTQTAVKNVHVPLPPLPEQRKIAEILGSADMNIENTQAMIAKLQDLKKATMQELLTKGIGHTKFKDSPVGSIPEEWDTPTFEEITRPDASICYGIVQPGPYVPDGVPVLAIKNLNTNYRDNVHKTSDVIEKQYVRSRVGPGDVLLSVKGTTGRVGIVPDHFRGNISRDIARIRLRETNIPEFYYQMLQSPIAQSLLDIAVVGTTRSELSIGILKQVRVVQPQKQEQQEIADILTSLASRIESRERHLAKLQALKKALMQDLLTGKVRVKI